MCLILKPAISGGKVKKKISEADAKKRIDFLVEEISRHDYLYYVKNEPEISDEQYDALYRELKELEEQFPHLKRDDSPTQRVGGSPLKEFKQVKHKIPMLSLDNTYNEEEIRDWVERNEKIVGKQKMTYVIEPKIDGVGISLRYENGKLKLGATRGDGITGDDITHNIKTIRSIPLKLKEGYPEVLEVRGEVYMEKKAFGELNLKRSREKLSLFANPRNATAGTLKLLDPRQTAERKLSCFVYQAGEIIPQPKVKTHWEMLEYFKKLGLRVNEHIKKFDTIDGVIKYAKKFEKIRDTLEYEVDGMVIKVNELELYEKLGTTLKAPRWAVAFKFAAKQGSAQILSVDVQVGRTGVLTPVANLSPTKIGGVVIKRATLHNFDEVKRLGVKVGDWVWVERSGDVIPKITGVITSKRTGKEKDIPIPQKCPVCGSPVFKDEENVAIVCQNSFCPAQIERGLIHFASRKAMDIEGLGEKVVHELIEKGLVKNFADIYRLKMSDLLELPLFKEKKAQNLLKGIEASKQRPLSRFLFAIGIPLAGEKACEILAEKFKTLERIMNAKKEELEEIPGIGPKMAEAIVRYFSLPVTRKNLKELAQQGVKPVEQESRVKSDKLKGKVFVFTGTIPIPRSQAEKMVAENGGRASSSVSSNTDYVVVGENPGSKFQKAKQLNIKTITYEEFLKLLK